MANTILKDKHKQLLQKAERFISEASMMPETKQRTQQMISLFTQVEDEIVVGKCPPGKVLDPVTMLCVPKTLVLKEM